MVISPADRPVVVVRAQLVPEVNLVGNPVALGVSLSVRGHLAPDLLADNPVALEASLGLGHRATKDQLVLGNWVVNLALEASLVLGFSPALAANLVARVHLIVKDSLADSLEVLAHLGARDHLVLSPAVHPVVSQVLQDKWAGSPVLSLALRDSLQVKVLPATKVNPAVRPATNLVISPAISQEARDSPAVNLSPRQGYNRVCSLDLEISLATRLATSPVARDSLQDNSATKDRTVTPLVVTAGHSTTSQVASPVVSMAQPRQLINPMASPEAMDHPETSPTGSRVAKADPSVTSLGVSPVSPAAMELLETSPMVSLAANLAVKTVAMDHLATSPTVSQRVSPAVNTAAVAPLEISPRASQDIRFLDCPKVSTEDWLLDHPRQGLSRCRTKRTHGPGKLRRPVGRPCTQSAICAQVQFTWASRQPRPTRQSTAPKRRPLLVLRPSNQRAGLARAQSSFTTSTRQPSTTSKRQRATDQRPRPSP